MKGTKEDFDPYTYGQVRLDSSQGPDASAGRVPEDILFQQGPDSPPAGSAFGASNYPAELEKGPGAGFQFDSEILGESGPGLAPMSTQPFGGQPAAPPPSALTQRRQPMGRPAAEFEPAPKAQLRPREVPVAAMRPRQAQPRMGRLGLFLPTLMLACGLGAGAWMYLVWQNVVLALLTAALGSVGAAFAWIWVRS